MKLKEGDYVENTEGLNEKKIDYKAIKLKRAELIKTGRIFFLTGLLTLAIAASFFINPEKHILGYYILGITIAFQSVGVIMFLSVYRMHPLCAICKQKTIYLDNINRFYCEHCNKYF